MRLLKIMLLLSVPFFSCKKDNGSKLPVIKGIQKRNIDAQPVGLEGVPNIKTSRTVDLTGDPEILAFPNPASNQLAVSIYSDGPVQGMIRMVRGRYKGGSFGPDNILGIGIYIPIDQVVDLKAGRNIVSLDLANVKDGYYRLYVDFGSYTLWDNIKVDR